MDDMEKAIKKIEQGDAWEETDKVVHLEVKKPMDKVIPVRLPSDKWEQIRQEARELGGWTDYPCPHVDSGASAPESVFLICSRIASYLGWRALYSALISGFFNSSASNFPKSVLIKFSRMDYITLFSDLV